MGNAMNKKGSLSLRNILFMVVIASALIMLSTILVRDMSTAYSNPEMYTEYTAEESVGSLGEDTYEEINESMFDMSESLSESTGSFGALTGTIEGVGSILEVIVKSPLFIKDAVIIGFNAMGIPTEIANIIGNALLLILIAIVIFVIISALSRGGTKL